jgi:hypothetical protein
MLPTEERLQIIAFGYFHSVNVDVMLQRGTTGLRGRRLGGQGLFEQLVFLQVFQGSVVL